jgi:DNA-3-methyladenine glycosylase
MKRSITSPFDWNSAPVLPREFYARDTVTVARALLGKVLVSGSAAGIINETEAYLPAGDLAAHAARGRTPRTGVLYGPPGHAYVFFIYGMYECLNVVAEPAGTPGCVLIRSVQPLAGVHRSSNGPGKLTMAFGITRRHDGADLTHGELTIREGMPHRYAIGCSPRIGIRNSADLPLRFFLRSARLLHRG